MAMSKIKGDQVAPDVVAEPQSKTRMSEILRARAGKHD
jgi:hypothetical protein